MIEFSIPDMSCGHCVATINKAISAVDPAAKAEVNLNNRTARVQTSLDPAKLVAALDDAGYPSTWKQV